MNDNHIECIVQLKEGSYEAFSELYMHYSNKLYSFALAQTKNTTLAEDIVHALLFTIARNLIIDGFRKQIVKINFDDYRQACNEVSSWPTPDEQVNYQEFVDRLQQTKKLLSKRACQIYEMSREQNMPIQEIANSLNLSSQTVKNYLSSTLKILRKKMIENRYFFLF